MHMARFSDFLSLIKFSHTVFALPFALLGFFLAVMDSGRLDVQKLLLVIACMVFARSSAMAFNRYLDRDIDKLNPRTAGREIPAGQISASSALLFVAANASLFILCAAWLNRLCFYLSPIALIIILGYSYTKRFTYLCHFVLGLGLALAPVGAYLAPTASWATLPILYGLVVLFWVSGFDIVYALQDEEFDRSHQLNSIPTRLGRTGALQLGRLLHFCCAMMLIYAMILQYQAYSSVGILSGLATLLFTGLLIYQHLLVRPDDLSRINLAFFTTNGMASLLFCSLVIIDFYV